MSDVESDATLDLGFLMVLSNDSIGAPVMCYAVSKKLEASGFGTRIIWMLRGTWSDFAITNIAMTEFRT